MCTQKTQKKIQSFQSERNEMFKELLTVGQLTDMQKIVSVKDVFITNGNMYTKVVYCDSKVLFAVWGTIEPIEEACNFPEHTHLGVAQVIGVVSGRCHVKADTFEKDLEASEVANIAPNEGHSLTVVSGSVYGWFVCIPPDNALIPLNGSECLLLKLGRCGAKTCDTCPLNTEGGGPFDTAAQQRPKD